MRIYELFHELINKFVPMDDMTKNSLKNDAGNFYTKAVKEAEDITMHNETAKLYNEAHKDKENFTPEPMKTMPLKAKIIGFCESWYMRYLFAALFVLLVPKIKAYLNGDPNPEDDEDDSQDDMAEFLEWKRFKASRT